MTGDVRHLTLTVTDALGLVLGAPEGAANSHLQEHLEAALNF